MKGPTALGDVVLIYNIIVKEQHESLMIAYNKAIAEGVPEELAANQVAAKAILQYAKEHRMKRVTSKSLDQIIRHLAMIRGFKSVTVLR